MTPDSEYIRCAHGYMRAGWCWQCQQEAPIRWLDRIERPLSRLSWIALLLGLLYIGGQVAIHIV